MIATIKYVPAEIPMLEHQQVREILIQNRFSLNNKITIGIHTGGLIDKFEYLVNLKLNDEEKKWL